MGIINSEEPRRHAWLGAEQVLDPQFTLLAHSMGRMGWKVNWGVRMEHGGEVRDSSAVQVLPSFPPVLPPSSLPLSFREAMLTEC